MRFVKGANSSRAGFKAKHKAENQDNGILLPFWSMEKKIHFFLPVSLLISLSSLST